MILDSPIVEPSSQAAAGRRLNDLFWHGEPDTSMLVPRTKRLIEQGTTSTQEAGFPLQLLYEFGGLPAIEAMLTLLEQGKGRRLWKWIIKLGNREITTPSPFTMEVDLAGEIAFRELNFAAPPSDCRDEPLSPSNAFVEIADKFSPFEREPFALRAELPTFTWPLLVVSGDRDIRAPRATAAEIVTLAPNGVLIEVREHGHSALDTAQELALQIMRDLRDYLAASDSSTRPPLPHDPTASPSLMSRIISTRLALARALPARLS
ncbi:alpha/beta fold hydrolase [Micropruina sonneratiae]|uniref:alpha/beta fold hydrolase n=1 Tax=Micropruina sonneratiae TaxID=2986940 RepID=UPI002226E133|nr:hypothetical protein [Micropruina sp. KQZ13P-5]MCW3159578.1 hypothetical protein [Micropruina sp. KQZ13P-5]